MILAIADVLSKADLDDARQALGRATFVDGRATAGWAARLVKSNLQAEPDAALEGVRDMIEQRLRQHAVFALATRPKTILGPLFSRYEPGHAYGTHVDDALLAGTRSDVSFTLFLSPPEDYQGGELVVDTPFGEEAIKLPAGSVFTYPASMLHRVEPVTAGTRLVAAGWVRSLVRDPARRELLFELETARRRLFEREGKSADGDLLARCAANLLRMWCDD